MENQASFHFYQDADLLMQKESDVVLLVDEPLFQSVSALCHILFNFLHFHFVELG